MDAATTYPEANVPDGEETRKFLGQTMGFENELISQSNSPTSHRRDVLPRMGYVSLRQAPPDALKVSRLGIRALEFVPGPAASGPEYAVNAPPCARRKAAQRRA